MRAMNFEYGFVARSIYVALLWFVIIVHWHFPHLLFYYLAFLVFLGVGLKPFLIKSGLYALYQGLRQSWFEKSNDKFVEQRRRQVDNERTLQAYKSARKRDPRLPKNW